MHIKICTLIIAGISMHNKKSQLLLNNDIIVQFCVIKIFSQSIFYAELDYVSLIVYENYINNFFLQYSSLKSCLTKDQICIYYFHSQPQHQFGMLFLETNQIHRFSLSYLIYCFLFPRTLLLDVYSIYKNSDSHQQQSKIIFLLKCISCTNYLSLFC